MKVTKGKKIAMACFAGFLAFMAVCTVVAKGIYASGLPRVTTAKPYSGSLTHIITVNGTVVQGQEYGVYVETGLRVDTVAVVRGEVFQAGQELFRIETVDLADKIGQCRLEISKLEVQMAAAVKEDSSSRQSRKREADRAREDYERAAVLADARIQECRQAYEAAQKALALYDQYLTDSAQTETGGENGENPPVGAGSTTGADESGGAIGDGGNGSEPGNADDSGAGEAGEGIPSGSGAGGIEEGVPSGSGVEGTEDKTHKLGISIGGSGAESSMEDRSFEPGRSAGSSVEESSSKGGSAESGSSVEPPVAEERVKSGDTGNESSEPEGSSSLHEVSSEGMDPERNYSRQEKRLQLEQNVIKAAQALEEAERQKEDSLREAVRTLEDANAALDAANAAVNTLALEIAYQKEGLSKLEELLEADGWVYAEAAGRVTQCSLEVGGRTQDGASLIYAMDDGERNLSAAFSEAQGKYISVGTQFEMKATLPDGSRVTGTALLDYLEKGADGAVHARLSFDLPDMSIGQSAELTYRMQTDSFSTCISRNCIYQEGENGYYIYIAEEQEGILGAEWKVRKVGVRILDQNDTVAAVQSVEITGDTRIVSGTDKACKDGDTVRVVQ